jgi:hypothetical protein
MADAGFGDQGTKPLVFLLHVAARSSKLVPQDGIADSKHITRFPGRQIENISQHQRGMFFRLERS